jgi:hypothetical protein
MITLACGLRSGTTATGGSAFAAALSPMLIGIMLRRAKNPVAISRHALLAK